MNDGILRVRHHGEVVAEIPNGPLVNEAPVYDRPVSKPAYLATVASVDESAWIGAIARGRVAEDSRVPDSCQQTLGLSTQDDHMVRTNSLVLAGMGAGVVRVKGTKRALAMSTGQRPLLLSEPAARRVLALAEAARNVACAGALPIGATNCLNFGNPERPEIMWQFVEAVEGLAEACRALEIPITGGNVSLYNETDGLAIYPTRDHRRGGRNRGRGRVVSRTFKQAGDEVVLLGDAHGELGGSEYLKVIHGLV